MYNISAAKSSIFFLKVPITLIFALNKTNRILCRNVVLKFVLLWSYNINKKLLHSKIVSCHDINHATSSVDIQHFYFINITSFVCLKVSTFIFMVDLSSNILPKDCQGTSVSLDRINNSSSTLKFPRHRKFQLTVNAFHHCHKLSLIREDDSMTV